MIHDQNIHVLFVSVDSSKLFCSTGSVRNELKNNEAFVLLSNFSPLTSCSKISCHNLKFKLKIEIFFFDHGTYSRVNIPKENF